MFYIVFKRLCLGLYSGIFSSSGCRSFRGADLGNINYDSYHHIVDMVLIDHFLLVIYSEHRTLTLHYLINDVLMALFFAIAGKEVWEAVALKSGSLRGKKAMTPLIATAGGIIGPAGVYLLGAYMVGKLAILSNGWAIPIATDIAFSYLVGRIIFGAKHPAVGFLLLLAIADDAAGLVILAVFIRKGTSHLSGCFCLSVQRYLSGICSIICPADG